MIKLTVKGLKPLAGGWYLNRKSAVKQRFSILCLTALTIFMAGMNFFPNNWIDPFTYIYRTKSEKAQLIPLKNEFFSTKVTDRFKSVDDLANYVRRNSPDTADKLYMARYLNKILKRRFIHAYAIYTTQENWITVLAGRFVWRDLCAKVIPDEIMKGNVAACSQVSIIFMEACRKLGIPSRKVGMIGHYALETYANGDWYFFDADMKPDFRIIKGHKSLGKILQNKEHLLLYSNTPYSPMKISRMFSKVYYGIPNESPAPRAALFHVVTKGLSHWGWIAPLIGAIILIFKKEKIAVR
ncbi:MAG: hypothetical protein WC716_01845 [Chitinophagaceae bacterium]|jgi:hypothetical protein